MNNTSHLCSKIAIEQNGNGTVIYFFHFNTLQYTLFLDLIFLKEDCIYLDKAFLFDEAEVMYIQEYSGYLLVCRLNNENYINGPRTVTFKLWFDKL